MANFSVLWVDRWCTHDVQKVKCGTLWRILAAWGAPAGTTSVVVKMVARGAAGAEVVSVNFTIYKFRLYICFIFTFWHSNVDTSTPVQWAIQQMNTPEHPAKLSAGHRCGVHTVLHSVNGVLMEGTELRQFYLTSSLSLLVLSYALYLE